LQKSRKVTPLLPSFTLKMVPRTHCVFPMVLVRVGERNTLGGRGDGDPRKCEREHPKNIG
jgi:hypothetical protein